MMRRVNEINWLTRFSRGEMAVTKHFKLVQRALDRPDEARTREGFLDAR